MTDSLILESHGAAFGDASHHTTRLMLEALDAIAKTLEAHDEPPPARICDMGCGSGILSLRAAQLWPDAHIVAADVLRESVEATRANAEANGVPLTILHSDGFSHPELTAVAPFDLILMNILAEPILRLLYDAEQHLAHGGLLMLSGMLVWQEQQIIDAAQSLGLELAQRMVLGDWVSQLWVKP